MLKYSIIINTYNWPQALDLCLHSLLVQLKEHEDVNVIVADDGSTSDTKSIVEKYQTKLNSYRLKHIWQEDSGFRRTKILNKAILASDADYILFLDGDCVVFPDYIAQHKRLAKRGYLVDGNRVLLSAGFSRQLINDSSYLNKVYTWGMLNWLIARLNKQTNKLIVHARIKSQFWRYLNSKKWTRPKGCNLAMWREDLLRVNGYDESFVGWGHEDSDLVIRLLHLGIKLKNARFAIPVLHLWHASASRQMASHNKSILLSILADPTTIQAKLGLTQYNS